VKFYRRKKGLAVRPEGEFPLIILEGGYIIFIGPRGRLNLNTEGDKVEGPAWADEKDKGAAVRGNSWVASISLFRIGRETCGIRPTARMITRSPHRRRRLRMAVTFG